MLDLHQQFIAENTSAELSSLLTHAYDVLITLGSPGLDDSLEEIIMLDDTVDVGVSITRITHLLRDLQQDMLRKHDISLVDNVELSQTSNLLSGILALSDYEDMPKIYQIANSDQDPIEIFAELMELFTPYQADNLVMSLEDVGISLIKRVRELAGTREEELITDEERMERAKYVGKVNQFCHYTRSRHYQLVQLLESGWSVGYPYVVYADTIGRGFEGIVPDQIAKEMVIMALASSDGSSNPLGVIKPNLERYIASINVITKVDIEVTRLLQGFDRG